MDNDDVNKLSAKLVKLPIFTGNHMDFHTWWFCFQVFAMVWKIMEAIERTSKPDLPRTTSATVSTNEATQREQMLAKRQNAITFANLTTALD